MVYQPFVSSCRFYRLRATGPNIRYSGVNCALGPSKSISYSGDFVIAGFVIAGFVSTYFTVILPGFHRSVHYNGAFVIAGCHCSCRYNHQNPKMTEEGHFSNNISYKRSLKLC